MSEFSLIANMYWGKNIRRKKGWAFETRKRGRK
jgi:hypothetical protein